MLQLKRKVLNEIELIPEDQLADLYNFIHQFRLKLERKKTAKQSSLLSFAGCWNDLDDDVFDEIIDDIKSRRQAAFRRRRTA